MSLALDDIASRLAAGARLSAAEVDALAATHDLVALGALADEVRRRRHGDRVTFVRVAESHAGAGGPERVPPAARELRIVGTPPTIEDAEASVRALAGIAEGVPITGFALDELARRCRGDAGGLTDALRRLRDAGLALVAEIVVERAADASALLEAARRAGLQVARATVHRVGDWGRLDLVRRVAGWPAAGVVRAFAPLPREAGGTQPSTGYDDVRQVALARLLVDNIDSIQVDWTLYGPKLAQVALTFGADDVDAVSPIDTLDLGLRRAPLEEIRRNIRAVSLVPSERNGRFEILVS